MKGAILLCFNISTVCLHETNMTWKHSLSLDNIYSIHTSDLLAKEL